MWTAFTRGRNSCYIRVYEDNSERSDQFIGRTIIVLTGNVNQSGTRLLFPGSNYLCRYSVQ